MAITEVRALFDGMNQEYPQTFTRLSATASIIYSPVFEAAIVKLQDQLHLN